jgi:hypothetical protein
VLICPVDIRTENSRALHHLVRGEGESVRHSRALNDWMIERLVDWKKVFQSPISKSLNRSMAWVC